MSKKFKRLTYTDRRLIKTLYKAGEKVETIAKAVGVAHTTIYLELKQGATSLNENGKLIYKLEAEIKAEQRKKEQGPARLTPQFRSQRTWEILSK